MVEIFFLEDNELKEILIDNTKEIDIGITTKVIPKVIQKSRKNKELYSDIFEKEIVCISVRRVIVGANYKDLLIRNSDPSKVDTILKESFKLPWGEWIENNNTLIKHKDNYYLRVYSIDNNIEKTYTYIDGTEIGDSKMKRLIEFLPKKRNSNDDKKVIVNNLKLSTIIEIIIDDYIIKRA